MELRHLRRTPAPFAGNNLIQPLILRMRANDQGLQDTPLLEGCRKFLQSFGVETATGLVRVGRNLFDRDQNTILHRRGRRIRRRIGKIHVGHQGGQTATKPPLCCFAVRHHAASVTSFNRPQNSSANCL